MLQQQQPQQLQSIEANTHAHASRELVRVAMRVASNFQLVIIWFNLSRLLPAGWRLPAVACLPVCPADSQFFYFVLYFSQLIDVNGLQQTRKIEQPDRKTASLSSSSICISIYLSIYIDIVGLATSSKTRQTGGVCLSCGCIGFSLSRKINQPWQSSALFTQSPTLGWAMCGMPPWHAAHISNLLNDICFVFRLDILVVYIFVPLAPKHQFLISLACRGPWAPLFVFHYLFFQFAFAGFVFWLQHSHIFRFMLCPFEF